MTTKERYLSIGLMSGTSMDGIDAALIETNGEDHIVELGSVTVAYDPRIKILLKAAEFSVQACHGDLKAAEIFYTDALKQYLLSEQKKDPESVALILQDLTTYLQKDISLEATIELSTKLHIDIVNRLLEKEHKNRREITVIGYHGQTLFHRPSAQITIQVGDGQMLADQTGIQVVNNFRSSDIRMGGQGAPLAPIYHLALAKRDQKIPLVVVNCGGIANITLIKNSDINDLIGFDTGPGNGLIDRLVQERTHGKELIDTDGKYGKRGKVDENILNALQAKAVWVNSENYFSQKIPKSLDIRDMKLIPELNTLSLEDACATLEAFTAITMVNSIDLLNLSLSEIPLTWILVGGGWNNPVILENLKWALRKKLGDSAVVLKADEAGWNSQAMEAQIFAYLAVRNLRKLPISFPGTTRVPSAASGGDIYFPIKS